MRQEPKYLNRLAVPAEQAKNTAKMWISSAIQTCRNRHQRGRNPVGGEMVGARAPRRSESNENLTDRTAEDRARSRSGAEPGPRIRQKWRIKELQKVCGRVWIETGGSGGSIPTQCGTRADTHWFQRRAVGKTATAQIPLPPSADLSTVGGRALTRRLVAGGAPPHLLVTPNT